MPMRARSSFTSIAGRQDVVPVEHDLALGALLRIEAVHAVEAAQQRRLAAARRADQRRHLPVVEVEVDVLQRLELAVVEVEVPHGDPYGALDSRLSRRATAPRG